MYEQELKIIPPYHLIGKMPNGLVQEIRGDIRLDGSGRSCCDIFGLYFRLKDEKEKVLKREVTSRLVQETGFNGSLVADLISEKVTKEDFKKYKLTSTENWIDLLVFIGAMQVVDDGHFIVVEKYRMFYEQQPPQVIEQIDVTEKANPKREDKKEQEV